MATENERGFPSSEALPPLLVPSTLTSIAILPFVNLTGEAAKEYFADALAEELIHTLSRAPALFRVPARTSSFAYKGRNIDARTVARELDVTSILEGSVRSMDDGVRVTAQLIDGGTGHHVWSRSYERSFDDPSRLQDELTIEIADALTLGGSNESIGTQKLRTRDLQAYQLFLQAKSLNMSPTETNVRGSLDMLADALHRDPGFARGWQSMAFIRGYLSVAMHYSIPDALRDAARDARQALTLDPSLSGSRAILAFISACRGKWTQAEHEFRATRALLPEDPELRLCYAIYLAQSVGHLHRAREDAQAACLLSPMGPLFVFNVGLAYLLDGHDADARRFLEQACAHGLPEDAGPVPDVLAHLARREGRLADAARYVSNALSTRWRVSGGVEVVRAVFAAFGQSSQRSTAIVLLRDLEQKLRAQGIDEISSKRLITWYTLLGALDFAYEAANFALDTLARSGTVGCAWGILWTEEMRAFRADARFQSLVQRLGLMEYWAQYGPPDGCELWHGIVTCSSASSMTAQRNRAPLATEVSPQRHPSDGSVRPEPGDSNEKLAIGQRLSGRYRIERELGEGGMGVAYLVSDEQVAGETFAVKVLKEGLDPEALDLLREEVRKTRKLSHPNIVDVHSVNVDGTRLYVLMEYLEGKSLNALLDEEFGRGMTFSHAWPIIEDVGAALGYAHDHNVIHSDLKPANIFLTNSGRTKLLDFGIARVSRGPLLYQRSGPLALTPAYASCEMLEGEEADARDDIYAFACVIYEMLCGKRPFGELTALEARDAGAQVPPLGVLSRKQNAVLAQGLAFDRKGRTSSVEQLLEGLADSKPRARPIARLTGAAIATVAALSLTYLALDKLWISRRSVMVQQVASDAQPANPRAAATPATFNPPPHSIAVLPFVNISGDKEQEYFSDGLTEELLNSLAEIEGLQVAARTSSFSFKEHPDIASVAHKLNVAAVLEGSVRRSANKVRVTAQLINTVTGFHFWSKTYDRDLGDVLKLQTEIATAVASALEVTLLGDVPTKIELGGTRNPAAFDAYLRASKAYITLQDVNDLESADAVYQSAATAYTEAIGLDPNYALALAGRSMALAQHATNQAGPAQRGSFDKALADARRAIALAPELGEAHLALAVVLQSGFFDFAQAGDEYSRALSLAPGDARVLRDYGAFAVDMGHTEAGLAAIRHAVRLDPLSTRSHYRLGEAQWASRRYNEAVAAFEEVISLDPDASRAYAWRGLAYYGLGDFQRARSSCEAKASASVGWWPGICLAIVYDKLERHVDAESMLTKFTATLGDVAAYQYAEIYAQWGNTAKALEWLDTAVRLSDTGLRRLKMDPLLDPLRKEPRFQAVERQLKFPN